MEIRGFSGLSGVVDRRGVNQQELARVQRLGDRRGVETPVADRVSENFATIDRNDNGRIGRAERRIARRDAVDQDGGGISASEISNALEKASAAGVERTPRLDYALENYAKLDQNQDGTLNAKDIRAKRTA